MKYRSFISLFVLFGLATTAFPATITYTYDGQYRLTQVTYSDSQKECFSYDAANNLDLYMALTDSKYFNSFLLYFAHLGGEFRPKCYRDDYQPDLIDEVIRGIRG